MVYGVGMTFQIKPPPEPVGTNEHGYETHPSWVQISAHRIRSTGHRLVDSSIPHNEFVELRICPATRKRDLHHDWWFGETTPMVSIEMSMAQWGAFVSSFGTTGIPATLAFTAADGDIPQEPHDVDSRLALSAKETRDATAAAIADVQAAEAAVAAAFDANVGRKQLRELLSDLHYKIANMPANAKFAADQLTKHAEDVTTKARFDIEAMVAQHAQTLGISAAPIISSLQLEPGEPDA